MPGPDDIRMVSPEGATVSVPRDAVPYHRSRGYDFETGTDLGGRLATEAVDERNVDRGLLGDVAAGGAGFARGISYGLSDVVAPDLGIERDTLRELRDQNGTISTIGEIGGAVAGALLTGGTGTVGTVARATPAGAAAVLGSRIAAKGGGGVLRAAAGSAVEGAAQSTGSYLSHVALGDTDLSAEGFVASGLTGAAFGGAVGGGLAAAEKGFIAARKLFPKHEVTEEAVKLASDNVDTELTKALSAGDDSVAKAKEQLEIMRLQRAELDVAAQQRVLEKRAAEAAKAQSAADLQAQRLATQRELDEVRVAKAKAPKTSRPGKAGQTASPIAESVGDVVPPPSLAGLADEALPAPAIADDVVGAPIGNASPSAGDDLEALLGQSVARARGGESMAALAKEARPPSALDEIHEAMAELDPDAAKLVSAVRAQEAAAADLTKRFKVRAPQEIGGSTTKVIPDAPDLTLGRVKQMYEKATEAERAALLDQIGSEKAKALLEIVEGRAGFAKWYKNKNHWWDDPTYGPLPTRPGPSADDLGDLAPRALPGFEGAVRSADDFARMADEDMAHVLDMNRAADEITAYERSVSDLAQALGPNAPPSAADMAARYTAALDDQARKASERLAQVADDAPIPSPVLAQGSGPVPMPSAPVAMADALPTPGSASPLADQLAADSARAAGTAQAADLISLPGATGAAMVKAPKGKAASMLADLGAANEALQFAGINLPFMPDVDKIPVVGPLLGGYLKLRAMATGLGRAGFKVPLLGEAKVAAGSAATRDRVAKSVDRLLGGAAKATRAARPVAAQAWRAPDVLRAALFPNEGEPRRTSKATPADLLRDRADELLAAQSNPAGLKAHVRAQLKDVRDPDVIAAVYAVTQRKFDYLAKHVPIAPPPSLLSKSTWTPSPAEVERFARRVRAANDPVSVLDDVGTGRVTPEGAETLREVYPRLYAEAQARLVSQAVKLNASLPHATVVRLSVLFDAPLTSSLEPDNLIAIQAAGQPTQPAQAPMGPPPGAMAAPPPAGAPDLSSLFMTSAEKRAAR